MQRPLCYLLVLFGLLFGSGILSAADRFLDPQEGDSYAGKVVVVKVGKDDLVNQASFRFFRRQIEKANKDKARAIVFELDTPGGYAFDTIKLIVKDLQTLEIPSYAFVNSEATSAGAITAFGCDKIYMHPVSTIGSAAVVTGVGGEIEGTMKAKIESFMNAAVTAVTEEKGHDPEVARAMMFVDEEYEFGDIASVKKGALLNLTAKQAASEYRGKPLLAAGLVRSVDELLKAEGIEAEVVEAAPTGFEKFAYWVAEWSFVLIAGGLIFAYIESQAPGFGVGGALSLICFGIFFFGNNMAGNLAGYEHVALFVVGILLIVVELFLVPGFIIPGVLGVMLLIGSLISAMGAPEAWDAFSTEGVTTDSIMDALLPPLMNLSLGLVIGVILILLMMRYLTDLPFFRSFKMETSLASGTAGNLQDDPTTPAGGKILIGHIGIAVTDLRPVGKAVIGEEKYQVTLRTGFLSKGEEIVVVSQDGFRILVDPRGEPEPEIPRGPTKSEGEAGESSIS